MQNSWLLHRSKTRRRSAQAKLEHRRRHLVVDCLNTKLPKSLNVVLHGLERFGGVPLPRPYRAWGYPITPVVFLLVTGFMTYYLLTERPLQSALGTLIMISGLLIYAVFRKRAVPGFPAARARE